jgi:hypothetical protein
LGGAVFAVVLIVTVTHLVGGGGGQQCTVGAPVASLNAQLRALGGFDQPYDAGDRQIIESIARQAASASAPGLIGALPADPVLVSSVSSSQANALVVPLLTTTPGEGAQHVSGLVSFLRDCSGRAYFSAVDDLTTKGSLTAHNFPSVNASVAAQRLGVDSPQLVYTASPFMPLWRNPSNGATIPAE